MPAKTIDAPRVFPPKSAEGLSSALRGALEEDPRAVFAYLHGSALKPGVFKDVDVAVYSASGVQPFALSADLKLAFSRRTGFPPDLFDVRMINDLPEKGDLFALVFLRNLFSNHELLVDRDPLLRADYIERYGMKYRECEGLIAEVLS